MRCSDAHSWTGFVTKLTYFEQVLLNVGLCIALRDIVRVGDSLILPGDGASHTEILFRYIVFRPRVGDIITGKIRSCSREGVYGMYRQWLFHFISIHHKEELINTQETIDFVYLFVFVAISVTLGFFDDILIPPTSLQHPSRFEEAEQAWVWEYPLEDGATHDLYMDIGEPIKFRVTGDVFEESSPIGPPNVEKPSTSSASTSAAASSSAATSSTTSANQPEGKTPYRIIVSSICKRS